MLYIKLNTLFYERQRIDSLVLIYFSSFFLPGIAHLNSNKSYYLNKWQLKIIKDIHTPRIRSIKNLEEECCHKSNTKEKELINKVKGRRFVSNNNYLGTWNMFKLTLAMCSVRASTLVVKLYLVLK